MVEEFEKSKNENSQLQAYRNLQNLITKTQENVIEVESFDPDLVSYWLERQRKLRALEDLRNYEIRPL